MPTRLANVDDKDDLNHTFPAGSPTVFANGKPVLRVGDSDTHGYKVAVGSSTVFVDGIPVGITGNPVIHPTGARTVISPSESTVFCA